MASQRVFIVAAPRSGAGLFHQLSCLDERLSQTELSDMSLVQIASEELGINSFASHQLLNVALSKEDEEKLKSRLRSTSQSGSGVLIDYHSSFGLNVDLLVAAFSEASFVFVSREFSSAVAKGISAWQSGGFVTEKALPTWWGPKWSLPLIPGWTDLIGEPTNEIVARQFVDISTAVVTNLEKLQSDRFTTVSFEQLLADPRETLIQSLSKLGIHWDASLPEPLPRVNSSSKPGLTTKINANMIQVANEGIQANRPAFQELAASMRRLGFEMAGPDSKSLRNQANGVRVESELGSVSSSTESANAQSKVSKKLSEGTPFNARFAGALPELLTKAKASLIFTAYNSGCVGTVRADGASIDTSYFQVPKPMGMALSDGRLAISTMDSILGFQMHNQLASKLSSELNPDVVFAPQSIIHTGKLDVHDMAYGSAPGFEGLWFINSAFSCLSILNPDFSFVPKWRPKWISGLAFENRCHLNGLAMVDGEPKYVTSLSQADTPNGWRASKGTSGVIVDITTNRLIADGLSMPHSPRWHKNKLYFLESGKGSLSTVDHRSGEVTTIATLPGFTRGLAFIGDFAIVGLSQVRDSAFKDLPVTATKQERNCGIWVVDTRSGKTVGTLKFDGIVQELFEITVVENSRWPMFIKRIPVTDTAFVLPKAAIKDLRSTPTSAS
jgi:uncharacterized protein (TIGR03032 family)